MFGSHLGYALGAGLCPIRGPSGATGSTIGRASSYSGHGTAGRSHRRHIRRQSRNATSDYLDRLLVDFQNCQKGFLGYLDSSDFLHSLFALFLLIEQLAFSTDVAAVTLSDNVLA